MFAVDSRVLPQPMIVHELLIINWSTKDKLKIASACTQKVQADKMKYTCNWLSPLVI